MQRITLPPAAHWYRSNVIVCTNDNTVLYGSRNNLVIINLREDTEECAKIRILRGHNTYIYSISVNKRYGEPKKYCATSTDNGSIYLWDLKMFRVKYRLNLNLENRDMVATGISGDDRVVGVTQTGVIVVWNFTSNTTTNLKYLLGPKTCVTCLSICPHEPWLVAIGMKNGLVAIVDVRLNGKVLYKLRGHEKSIVSLSWCPAPINIFTKKNMKILEDLKQNKDEDGNTVVNNEKLEKIEDVDNDDKRSVPLINQEESHANLESSSKNLDDSGTIIKNEKTTQHVENVEVSEKSTSEKKQVINQEKDGTPGETETVFPFRQGQCKDDANELEYLLASSASDRTVYVWRANSDGGIQTSFTIPKKTKNKKAGFSNQWSVVCWVAPDLILTNSSTNEVLGWKLPLSKNNMHKVIRPSEDGAIFNIVAPYVILRKDNWFVERNLEFWINKPDKIINFDIGRKEDIYQYSYISSQVSCMAQSVIDPNRLAIGLKDGSVKFWDLSRPNINEIHLDSAKKKLSSKITCLSWSGHNESLIAYGTEEGQVGYFDISDLSKHTGFYTHFRTPIFHIEWAKYSGNQLGVFAVADGKIAIFNIQKPNLEPHELDVCDNKPIHRFAWKLNFSILLVCLKDGALLVYNNNLELLNKFYIHDKGLNEIVWHPLSIDDNSDTTPCIYYFAVTVGKSVIVYDAKSLSIKNTSENLLKNKIASLDGHHAKPITALAWCGFCGPETIQIASAASDYIINIWDVKTAVVLHTISNYIVPHYPIALLWSPIDNDEIIIGDCSVTVMNLDGYPALSLEECLNEQKEFFKTDETFTPTAPVKPKVEGGSKSSSSSSSSKKPKNCIVPTLYTSSDENIELQVQDMRRLMKQFESGGEVVINGNHGVNDDDRFQLFGKQEDVMNLLTRNYNLHKKELKYNFCDTISLWMGDISNSIKEAIEENRVTPTIIALAPMVSPKLWQEACEVYAKKLTETADADPIEIATYFLACHKIEEAIDALCQASKFREALALAKCRLPDNSNIINKVIYKWATSSVENGNFEAAAFCYISIGDWENAAKILGRRSHIQFLELAHELAVKSGNKELCAALEFKQKQFGNVMEEKPLPSRIEAFIAAKNPTSPDQGSVDEKTNSNGDSEISPEKIVIMLDNHHNSQ